MLHQSRTSSRTQLKDIRKCPAQSNPHERISPLVLRRMTRFYRSENKTRDRWFHTDLQDCEWSREDKLVWRKQDTKSWPEDTPYSSPVSVQEETSRELTSFSTEWLPQAIIYQKTLHLHTQWTLSRTNRTCTWTK